MSDNDVNIILFILTLVFGLFSLFSIPYRYKQNTRVTRQTIKVHKIKFSEMIEPKIIGDEEETEEKTNYEELDIPF